MLFRSGRQATRLTLLLLDNRLANSFGSGAADGFPAAAVRAADPPEQAATALDHVGGVGWGGGRLVVRLGAAGVTALGEAHCFTSTGRFPLCDCGLLHASAYNCITLPRKILVSLPSFGKSAATLFSISRFQSPNRILSLRV